MDFYFGDSKENVERKADSLRNLGELEKAQYLGFGYNLPLLNNEIHFKVVFNYNNDRLFSVGLLNLDVLKPETISELNTVLIKKYGEPDLSFDDPAEKHWFKKGKEIYCTQKKGYLLIAFADKKPFLEMMENEIKENTKKLNKKLSKDF